MANSTSRLPVSPVLLVSGVASVFALIALALFWGGDVAPPRAVASATDSLLPAVRWPEGERHTFRVLYQNEDMLRPVVDDGIQKMVSDPMESSLSADLEMTVTGMGPGEGETDLVAVEVNHCATASWTAMEQPVWDDASACTSALRGHVLYGEIARDGTIAAVFDDADAEASTRLFLQTLLLRLQVTLNAAPDQDDWFASEQSVAGIASQIYSIVRRGEGREDWTFHRRTTAYRDLLAAKGMLALPKVKASGESDIALSTQGQLERVKGFEELSATTKAGVHFWSSATTFQFSRIAMTTVTPPLKLATHSRRKATTVPTGPEVGTQLLEHQADGLTLEMLVSNLKGYGNGGRFPNHERFLWRAVGLLQLHPEYAAALIPLYREAGATTTLQALILDLLASAGEDEAQAAMRELLADVDTLSAANAKERQLYQRLGFLKTPNEDTVAMVEDHYEHFSAQEPSPETFGPRLTTAYSLGAVAGRLAGGDDAAIARAQQLHQLLADDLAATTDPNLLQHMVTALGNTRSPDNAEILDGLSEHDDNKVRSSVARAYGKVPTEEPSAALLALAGDADVLVQRAAIHSLPPHPTTYSTLLALAEEERIAPTNIRTVIDLAKRGRSTSRELTTQLLETLIRVGISRGPDREAAYALLRL